MRCGAHGERDLRVASIRLNARGPALVTPRGLDFLGGTRLEVDPPDGGPLGGFAAGGARGQLGAGGADRAHVEALAYGGVAQRAADALEAGVGGVHLPVALPRQGRSLPRRLRDLSRPTPGSA